jgi:hypothetical protein
LLKNLGGKTRKRAGVRALSTWRRDLTIAGYPQVVQTTVGDEVIPFLRSSSLAADVAKNANNVLVLITIAKRHLRSTASL